MSSAIKFLFGGILLTLLSICAAGQDLGSSNKLFGGKKKPAAAPKAVKKAPAKSKSTPARTKAPVKKKAPVAKSDKSKQPSPKTAAPKPKAADGRNPKTAKKIEIAPVKRKEPPVRSSPETDALYEDLIEDGNRERDERNYLAADAAYKRARQLKPKDARAVYGLGNLYSDQQRWEAAEEAYRKSLEIDPSSAIIHVALSYVLTQPLAAPNLSERYEEAEKLARRAIQLAPSNALAFDQLGVALELRGLIGSETEDAYRTAIRLNSSFAPPYAHLGRLLRRRGLNRESEALYRSAIRRSTDVATMVLVADVMQSEQRFAESEELLDKALDDDPRNPAALLLFGRALTALGSFGEAEMILKKSLAVTPNGFMANSLLASLYLRQNKLELAENALLQALRFVSGYEKRTLSQQFETVGDRYAKAGRRAQAERAYRNAFDLDNERESLAGKLSKYRFGRSDRN